jgi:hypothetical protein
MPGTDLEKRLMEEFFKRNGYYPSQSSSAFDIYRSMRPGGTPTAEDVLGGAAQGLIKQTDPLREALISQSSDFLKGGMDPRATPEFSAIRQYADQQSKQAKDSILETMPSGGTLLDKLADVDIGKARTLTDASAGIYGENLSRAFSLATGAPLSTGMSGLGALTQLNAAREQSSADRDAAAKGGTGAAVGGLLGGVGDK